MIDPADLDRWIEAEPDDEPFNPEEYDWYYQDEEPPDPEPFDDADRLYHDWKTDSLAPGIRVLFIDLDDLALLE